MHSEIFTSVTKSFCLNFATLLVASGLQLETCNVKVNTNNCTEVTTNDCCLLNFCCWQMKNSAENCNVCKNNNYCCPKDYCCFKRDDETESRNSKFNTISFLIFFAIVVFTFACGYLCCYYTTNRPRREVLWVPNRPSTPATRPSDITDEPPPYCQIRSLSTPVPRAPPSGNDGSLASESPTPPPYPGS